MSVFTIKTDCPLMVGINALEGKIIALLIVSNDICNFAKAPGINLFPGFALMALTLTVLVAASIFGSFAYTFAV